MKSTSIPTYAFLITATLTLVNSAQLPTQVPSCGQAPPNYPYFQKNTKYTNTCLTPDSPLRFDITVGSKPLPPQIVQEVTGNLTETCTKFLKDNPPGPAQDNMYSTSSCNPIHPETPYDPNTCERTLCVNFSTKDGDNVPFHIKEELEVLNFLSAIPKSNQPLETTLLVKSRDGTPLASVCIQMSPSCATKEEAVCPAPV